MKAEHVIDNEAYLLSLNPEQLSTADQIRLTELFGNVEEALAYREFLLATAKALQESPSPSPLVQESLREKVRHRMIFRNGFTLQPFLSRFNLHFNWQYPAAAAILFFGILSFQMNTSVHPNQALMADTSSVSKLIADTSLSKGGN
jgi:hypothetical protein